MRRAPPVPWTREHLLIALNVYCKLPFGQLHKGNRSIRDIAARMGRTPSSLAMKLVNFASLDPVLSARGIAGMSGASRQDRLIWQEFHDNLLTLAPESEQLLHDLITKNQEVEIDLLQPENLQLRPSRVTLNRNVTEATALVKVRRGQQFFRQSVLSAYDVCCCISGMNVPELLVASHIRPWSDFPDDRLDPSNGLCLSSLHDSAFDAGLITLDESFSLILSSRTAKLLSARGSRAKFRAICGTADPTSTKARGTFPKTPRLSSQGDL